MYNYTYNFDKKYNCDDCKECKEYETRYNTKKKLNILVVDNDAKSSELFKNILELRGHNVKSLNDGISCITNCQHNNYDVIFLDYHISDIDRDQLVDFLKDIYKVKSLIFAYTSDNNTDQIIRPIDINLLNILMDNLESKITDIQSLKRIEKKYKSSIILFE
jgi:CheY-like chemotaxis protein